MSFLRLWLCCTLRRNRKTNFGYPYFCTRLVSRRTNCRLPIRLELPLHSHRRNYCHLCLFAILCTDRKMNSVFPRSCVRRRGYQRTSSRSQLSRWLQCRLQRKDFLKTGSSLEFEDRQDYIGSRHSTRTRSPFQSHRNLRIGDSCHSGCRNCCRASGVEHPRGGSRM